LEEGWIALPIDGDWNSANHKTDNGRP